MPWVFAERSLGRAGEVVPDFAGRKLNSISPLECNSANILSKYTELESSPV